jgi:hypothetical protein
MSIRFGFGPFVFGLVAMGLCRLYDVLRRQCVLTVCSLASYWSVDYGSSPTFGGYGRRT